MKIIICTGLFKCCSIFLILAATAFMLHFMTIMENKVKLIPISPKVSRKPLLNESSCTFQRLSPAEALEEKMLLDSIAWPEAPPLPIPFSLNGISHAAHSNFVILPKKGGGQWCVGDQLEVTIHIRDFLGRPKKYGGDYFLTRLHNITLGAGVAGQVVDHLNGTYTAMFALLWEGKSNVEIILDNPSEAVQLMYKFTKKWPDGVEFFSIFRSGSVTESSMCSTCLPPRQQPLCDYTDLLTGEPWFCYKPKKLGCDARITHYSMYKTYPKAAEDKLFKKGVTMKALVPASGPGFVTVFQKEEGQLAGNGSSVTPGPVGDDNAGNGSSVTPGPVGDDNAGNGSSVTPGPVGDDNAGNSSSVTPGPVGDDNAGNGSSVTPGPVGYYYRGQWRSLSGPAVQQFPDSSAINQCLREKVVYMYGDSTVRQWLEYLIKQLPALKVSNPHNLRQAGPYIAVDHVNKIFITYRTHGVPIRIIPSPVTELHYIANELDRVTGGKNTVVIFGVWAHFTTFPMEYYVRRVMNIRKAVVRLLARAPDTLIIIRSANLKNSPSPSSTLLGGNWHSLQRDKLLRAMFKGLNVHLLEAWEMTVASHLPHDIHPPQPIIKNMIAVILSYIGPSQHG